VTRKSSETGGCDLQMDEVEGWLKKEEGRQKKRKPHEDPLLMSADIDTRIDSLRKPFNRLKSKKKPKPAPSPKSGNSTAANSTAEDAVDQGGNDGEPEEEEAEMDAPEEGLFGDPGGVEELENQGGSSLHNKQHPGGRVFDKQGRMDEVQVVRDHLCSLQNPLDPTLYPSTTEALLDDSFEGRNLVAVRPSPRGGGGQCDSHGVFIAKSSASRGANLMTNSSNIQEVEVTLIAICLCSPNRAHITYAPPPPPQEPDSHGESPLKKYVRRTMLLGNLDTPIHFQVVQRVAFCALSTIK
jgi:hypothetical protein